MVDHEHDHGHEHVPGSGHVHQTPASPLEPAVDADSGRLERHCSRCGADVPAGEEFCQICAIEASGGELPPPDEG
jgi:hypothetical protein